MCSSASVSYSRPLVPSDLPPGRPGSAQELRPVRMDGPSWLQALARRSGVSRPALCSGGGCFIRGELWAEREERRSEREPLVWLEEPGGFSWRGSPGSAPCWCLGCACVPMCVCAWTCLCDRRKVSVQGESCLHGFPHPNLALQPLASGISSSKWFPLPSSSRVGVEAGGGERGADGT